jgi:hypothetical protein
MPRRRYPHVRHGIPRWSEYEERYVSKQVYARSNGNPFGRDLREKWMRQAGRGKGIKGTIRWPTVNGPNDPISIMCVLDCILRLDSDGYIQAGGLASLLSSHYKHIIWDSVNVGKILNGIAELGDDAALDKNRLPLGSTIWSGAKQYALTEDLDGWLYLAALRDRAGTLAEKLAREAHENQMLPQRTTVIWDELGQVAWGTRP